MILDFELGSGASLDGFLAKGKPAPGLVTFKPFCTPIHSHPAFCLCLLVFLEKVLPVGGGKASPLGGNRRRESTSQKAQLPAAVVLKQTSDSIGAGSDCQL